MNPICLPPPAWLGGHVNNPPRIIIAECQDDEGILYEVPARYTRGSPARQYSDPDFWLPEEPPDIVLVAASVFDGPPVNLDDLVSRCGYERIMDAIHTAYLDEETP